MNLQWFPIERADYSGWKGVRQVIIKADIEIDIKEGKSIGNCGKNSLPQIFCHIIHPQSGQFLT